MTQETLEPSYKTVAEKITEMHENANKEAFNRNKSPENKLGKLKAKDRELAQRMLPILDSSAFLAVQELLQQELINLMNNSFVRPAPGEFDSSNNDRGEWTAYKQGLQRGLKIAIQGPHILIKQYLDELDREDKNKKG